MPGRPRAFDRPPPAHLRPLRLFNRVRVRGPLEVGALAVERARGGWRSAETLIFVVRTTAGARPPPARDEITFREASRSDAEAYARGVGTDSVGTFRRRLTPGVRCFLITTGDTIVHSSWVTTSGAWTREIAAFVSPPAGDAYLYESFTNATQRGQGLYPFALASILHRLNQEGVAELWVGAEATNAASIKALHKAGFVEAFRLPVQRRMGRVARGPVTGPRARAASDLIDPQERPRGKQDVGDGPEAQSKQ